MSPSISIEYPAHRGRAVHAHLHEDLVLPLQCRELNPRFAVGGAACLPPELIVTAGTPGGVSSRPGDQCRINHSSVIASVPALFDGSVTVKRTSTVYVPSMLKSIVLFGVHCAVAALPTTTGAS